MDFSALPKIELHQHLDCSLSYGAVCLLHKHISREEYERDYVGPAKCNDLRDYLHVANNSVAIMQTPYQLIWATIDLFNQLSEDQVFYVEIRFAPLQHLKGGLTPFEVIDIVDKTAETCYKQYGIESGIILCTLRHFSEAESMQTIKLVEQFKGSRVVGFDIAGDEAGYPVDNHISAFVYADRHGIPCTAHAGEAAGASSMLETLSCFKPSRIGHGVRCVENAALMKQLKFDNIHLEVCPTSNIKTNVFDTYADHSIHKIYESGISMSVNTDGRGISNVTLEQEYKNLTNHFNWEKTHFLKCNLEAIEHAFTTPAIKQKLKAKILAAYG